MKLKSNVMQGRVIYLMVLIALIQTLYPLSFGEDALRLIAWQMLYLLMIVAGILVVRQSPRDFIILIVLGIFWIISGISFAIFPGTITYIFAYASIGMYQGWVAWVLAIYSYATLTTLGYGDITPSTLWARSFASLEAIIGVLFTTVVIARLVGLYSVTEIEEAMENQ